MDKIKKLFKTNSSTSPAENKKKKTNSFSTSFRRSNSSNKLFDIKNNNNNNNNKSDKRHLSSPASTASLSSPSLAIVNNNDNKNPSPSSPSSPSSPTLAELFLAISNDNDTSSNSKKISSIFSSHKKQHSTSIANNKIYSALALNANTSTMIANQGEKNTKEDSQELSIENQNEADEFIQKAIKFHESNELKEATRYFKLAADKKSPLGLFLYGIALRHGWGCKPDPIGAVGFLREAAQYAISDLQATVEANPAIARHELVMAIYELGVCFRQGWGVPKNKQKAAYYFEIAANLGDPDAQNELAFCYLHGEGVKKDMKKAAKYYRMADAQGASTLGNSWIHKKKYDED